PGADCDADKALVHPASPLLILRTPVGFHPYRPPHRAAQSLSPTRGCSPAAPTGAEAGATVPAVPGVGPAVPVVAP
ncbi:unnamed protein product, partial [Sphagnum balticum]